MATAKKTTDDPAAQAPEPNAPLSDHEYQKVLFQELAEPFPVEMERTLMKGGTALTYIPVSEVITRLNRVYGVSSWSSEIVRCERDNLDPDFIVAHVRLSTVDARGYSVCKDGIGGQKIKRTKSGDIVDLGDEFKGAISDALKKAAQQLGIGLYLARDPDAIEMDEARYSPVEKSQTEEMYETFIGLRNKLDETQVKSLREYWSTWSNGRNVPKPAEFTVEELEVLIAECTRLLLNGEYVVVSEEASTNDE